MACLGRVLVLLLAVGMAQRTIAALPFLYADELVARSDAQVVGRVMFVSQQELPRPRVEGQTDTVTTALVNIRDSGPRYHRDIQKGHNVRMLMWKPKQRPASWVGDTGHATTPARGEVYTFYVVKYDAENESHVAQYGTHDDHYPAFIVVKPNGVVPVGGELEL